MLLPTLDRQTTIILLALLAGLSVVPAAAQNRKISVSTSPVRPLSLAHQQDALSHLWLPETGRSTVVFPRGRKSHWLAGASIGTAIAGVASYVALTHPCPGDRPVTPARCKVNALIAAPFLGAFFGGIPGALIGKLFHKNP